MGVQTAILIISLLRKQIVYNTDNKVKKHILPQPAKTCTTRMYNIHELVVRTGSQNSEASLAFYSRARECCGSISARGDLYCAFFAAVPAHDYTASPHLARPPSLNI